MRPESAEDAPSAAGLLARPEQANIRLLRRLIHHALVHGFVAADSVPAGRIIRDRLARLGSMEDSGSD
jgi:hypothetical protein